VTFLAEDIAADCATRHHAGDHNASGFRMPRA
jgi:hypothetical protein